MSPLEIIREIEEDARELRLTEQSFFKNVIRSIKRQHKKVLLRVGITFAGLALVWGFLACPLLRSMHLCAWMR
jgi:sulfite exporter TauE/SafE